MAQFLKKNIEIFINNYLVPNAHIPAFFPILEILLKCSFYYREQLLFGFFFYLLNRSKTIFPFTGIFNLGKREKSAGAKSGEHGG